MRKINLKKLYRKDLANFTYWPLLPNFTDTYEYKNGYLKLDTGENIFDVPQNIMSKLKTLKVNYYPGISGALIDTIAKKDSITADQIFLGNGSKDLLDIICRLLIDPSDEVIICSPSYPLYSYFVQLSRGKIIDIPRINLTDLDITAIRKAITAKTKIIFIDNPSNPFGTVTSQNDIRTLLDAGIIVIVDEAYFEFCDVTAISLIKEYQNLIILRTFSKAMSMAGMRLAYAVSSKDIIDALVKIKIPNQVNIAAQKLGKELINNTVVKKKIKELIKGREFLIKELNTISFIKVFPSQGAYIVFQIISEKLSADQICRVFYENKIIIKQLDFPTLGNEFLRINIVPIEISKKIIKILNEYEI